MKLFSLFKNILLQNGFVFKRLMEETTLTVRAIGASSSAECLSSYIQSYDSLKENKELAKFMQFYVQHWQSSSSQWSQDLFAAYYGGKICESIPKTFLEVGAADGFTHSNTFSLEKHFGWKGTLVEPSSNMFKLLCRVRPTANRLKLIVDPDGLNTHHRLRLASQLTCIDSHQPDDMHSLARSKSREFEVVQSISLSSLLMQKYMYFSLDVEGVELQILQSLDWSNIQKPLIITVEHNHRPREKQCIEEILRVNGYNIIFTEYDWLCRGDTWAVLKN